MKHTRSDGGDAGAETGDADRGMAIDRRAIAQLPIGVVAPTPHRAAGGERARVVVSGRDLGDAGSET